MKTTFGEVVAPPAFTPVQFSVILETEKEMLMFEALLNECAASIDPIRGRTPSDKWINTSEVRTFVTQLFENVKLKP